MMQHSDTEQEHRYFITALARGLDVLACFRVTDQGLTNQQIAERCKLPKSTVTRVTFTLTQLGYLLQDLNGRYQLGTATLRLGSTMLSGLDIRQLARPMMQELADTAGATIAIAVRDRLSMIYVEQCRSKAALSLSLQVGSRLPLALSASGRAYLGMASAAERDDILRQAGGRGERIHQGVRQGMERAQRDQQQYGCATSFCEWQPEVNGIAVGFMPIGGSQLMSINCGGPSSSITREFLLDQVRPRLIETARRLSS
ncbi:helix-turn-helix domain-containing protein [Duganella sp. sic0402]|uniref:IclR family transcriptional regulator n=1 Tax=Duganella sp. sic0402 TaxID=2854786 RepID=UPI0027D9A6C8|nr:helix-turn-helix domain-containing protein [Duganella sp. sic0402]